MPDYETLKLAWWLVVGALLIGFAVMDGHDLGVGALLPVVGRSDIERQVVIHTIGPHWDGNQVWLVTGGGALFAAWPLVYATAFSSLYWAMLGILGALFLRPVGFHYRSKLTSPRWRRGWDGALCIGGAVPPLLFGIAFTQVTDNQVIAAAMLSLARHFDMIAVAASASTTRLTAISFSFRPSVLWELSTLVAIAINL